MAGSSRRGRHDASGDLMDKQSAGSEIEVGPAVSREPLSDATIAQIHDGLLIPNEGAIQNMAREIRKWRGDPNPDTI